MVHSRTRQIDPTRRSRLLSRILDPEYSGSPSSYPGTSSPALADLPQPSVFVDMWGDEHDPDFRPFATYPVVTPAQERESWPWDADEPDTVAPSPTSPRRSSTTTSHSTSSYHSSSSGSRSASVLASPGSSPAAVDADKDRPRISPPGTIPRAALFPWTPAQRAARLHTMTKRSLPPPSPLYEEEPEAPLTLVDSRYVPGYGHFIPPQVSRRGHTTAASAETSTAARKIGRFRSHTVPVSARGRAELATEDTEPDSESEEHQSRTSYTQLFRQSVYSIRLRTKLGLHHMKTRVRKASSAALRPLSL